MYSISQDKLRFTLHLANLTLCILGNFSCILSSADFFQNHLFWKILSGIPSECQTIWIQILIWVQTVCKGYQQTTIVNKEFKLVYFAERWINLSTRKTYPPSQISSKTRNAASRFSNKALFSTFFRNIWLTDSYKAFKTLFKISWKKITTTE